MSTSTSIHTIERVRLVHWLKDDREYYSLKFEDEYGNDVAVFLDTPDIVKKALRKSDTHTVDLRTKE